MLSLPRVKSLARAIGEASGPLPEPLALSDRIAGDRRGKAFSPCPSGGAFRLVTNAPDRTPCRSQSVPRPADRRRQADAPTAALLTGHGAGGWPKCRRRNRPTPGGAGRHVVCYALDRVAAV